MNSNFTTVSMSEVAASGRFDPGYHIAVKSVAQHLPLFSGLSVEEATAKAHKLVTASPPEVLVSALGPLVKGSSPRASMGPTQAREVASEYPHLALALLHKHLPQIISHRKDQLLQATQAMDEVLDFHAAYPDVTAPTQGSRKPGP